MAGPPIFILPHHRHRDGDFDGWAHLTPFQAAAHEYQMFAEGCLRGDRHDRFCPDHGDIVVKEHWGRPASSIPIWTRRWRTALVPHRSHDPGTAPQEACTCVTIHHT